VEVDDDRVRLLAQRTGGDLAFGRLERIVEFGMHEDPAHDVGDHHPRAVPGNEQPGSAPRRAAGKIGRTQEPLLARREFQRLALVPHMIAGGHHIGAGLQRGLEDVFGDAEAAGGVFAVDDHEIEPEIGNQAGQALPYRHASRPPHHVAEK
jgi:hypothetical protein